MSFFPASIRAFSSLPQGKNDIILLVYLKLAWLYCAHTLVALWLYCRAVGAISGDYDSSTLDRLLSPRRRQRPPGAPKKDSIQPLCQTCPAKLPD